MFGSDDLPLGPNNAYPRKRIGSFGNMVASPEEIYEMSGLAKLPIRERDYHSSVNRVKGKMKTGRMMREGQDEEKFSPRGLRLRTVGRRLKFGLGEEEELGALPKFTASGRAIATTWKYGRGVYYKTVKDKDGRVERGQIIGGTTKVIDYA
jgi:hypothetical protein